MTLSDVAYVTKANVDSSATLNIPSRSSVGNIDDVESGSSTSYSSSGKIKFRTRTIYADSGDRLRDLVGSLRTMSRPIITTEDFRRCGMGDIGELQRSPTTRLPVPLHRTAVNMSEATGTIRVRVGGDDNGDENVYLEIDGSMRTGGIVFAICAVICVQT